MRNALVRAARLQPHVLREGIDGCGVPTFYVPLHSMALAYANLARPTSEYWGDWAVPAQTILAAMTQHPEYVGGEGRYETNLMRVDRSLNFKWRNPAACPATVMKETAVWTQSLQQEIGMFFQILSGEFAVYCRHPGRSQTQTGIILSQEWLA